MAEKTVAAAQELLAINTNSSGGTEKYRERSAKVRKSLRELPPEWSAECCHARHILAAMDNRCAPKTPGTWRPFVVLLIKSLNPSEEQLSAVRKVAGKSASVEALLVAEEDVRAAAKGNFVHLDKKRPLALQTRSLGDQGLAQSSQNSTLALALPCNDLEQRLAERSSKGLQRFFGKIRKIEEDSPGASPAATATASVAGESQAASEEQRTSAVSPSGRGNIQTMNEEEHGEQSPTEGEQQQSRTEGEQQQSTTEGEQQQSTTDGGTASNSAAETSIAADPKGYYAQLRLAPGASPGDIRDAYKKLILVCHPDKGGKAQDFRAVVEAYNTLSDPDKRKNYDGHERFDAMTTAHVATKSPSDKTQLAKDVFSRMLLTPVEEWDRLLQSVDDTVVEMLSGELQEVAADGGRSEAVEKRKAGYSEYSAPGIKQRKDKTWWVQIGWRHFKISADRILCMERAVNLHAALVQTRNTAMARYRASMANLKKLSCADTSGAVLDSSIPVLTPSELASLLQEEPYIPIHFASDLPDPRIQTSWTPIFETAMEFRMYVRNVQSQEGNIKDLKAMMSKRAAEDRKERSNLTQRAAVLLKRITEVRQQERLQQSSTALESDTQPLALKEVANSEELMKAMKDMEVRMEQAWESRIQAMDQQYQRQMTQLLEEKQKHMQANMEERQEFLKEQQKQEIRLLEERRKHAEVLEEKRKHAEEFRLLEERHRHAEECRLQKERHIEERRQEEMQRLEEQLMEERMRSQISEQVAQRLENSLHARAQPRPNFFARQRGLLVDMPSDDSSRWMPEALNACKRSISRNFQPTPTRLEPAGSYGHRR